MRFIFRSDRWRSKSIICRKAEHYASTAKRSEAPDPENATACQGLPY
jgi:hypothetical protein